MRNEPRDEPIVGQSRSVGDGNSSRWLSGFEVAALICLADRFKGSVALPFFVPEPGFYRTFTPFSLVLGPSVGRRVGHGFR